MKACRRERPTGVDMAKMKMEASAARIEKHGVAWRERLVAELPRYAPRASRWRRSPTCATTCRRCVGSASACSASPRHARCFNEIHQEDARRSAAIYFATRRSARRPAPTAEVILFADTFNRYYESENFRAVVRVLRKLGLTPVAPEVTGRPLCCGRTYLSAGLVDKARRTLDALAGDARVLGLEPSCLIRRGTSSARSFPALQPTG